MTKDLKSADLNYYEKLHKSNSARFKQDFKSLSNLFEDWATHISLTRRTQVRAPLFYNYVKKLAKDKIENMSDEELADFNLLLRQVWKSKEDAGRIIRSQKDKNSFVFS